MRGIYEIVNLSKTLKDISFIFQRISGYTGLNTSQIVDAVCTHDGYYLGMLKETNNHAIEKLSKASIYI